MKTDKSNSKIFQWRNRGFSRLAALLFRMSINYHAIPSFTS